MSKGNYISALDVNQQKVIDYIFHNIPKSEEVLIEHFLDENEELAATVEDLLDFCLSHQLNQFMVQHLLKTGQSSDFNDILNDIEYYLNDIKEKALSKIEAEQTTFESQNPVLRKWLNIGSIIFNKTITK